MNKKIIFSGKHNIELIEGKKECKRINNILPSIDKKYLERKGQIEIINCLYLNQEFKDITIIKTELNRKIKGYQQQDKEKKIYNRDSFISFDQCIESLVISQLKCFYCLCDVQLLYENIRQSNQWTLDRIYNNIGHSQKNIVICCLSCNLSKRCRSKEAFIFTKQLKIKKKE
jgi:hypothetical protein|tara:strand:+ start:649 stop:1164 length:516 start_codon:yes stop_codon:yes gene_type:complete